jgi:hypothetical protein
MKPSAARIGTCPRNIGIVPFKILPVIEIGGAGIVREPLAVGGQHGFVDGKAQKLEIVAGQKIPDHDQREMMRLGLGGSGHMVAPMGLLFNPPPFCPRAAQKGKPAPLSRRRFD